MVPRPGQRGTNYVTSVRQLYSHNYNFGCVLDLWGEILVISCTEKTHLLYVSINYYHCIASQKSYYYLTIIIIVIIVLRCQIFLNIPDGFKCIIPEFSFSSSSGLKATWQLFAHSQLFVCSFHFRLFHSYASLRYKSGIKEYDYFSSVTTTLRI